MISFSLILHFLFKTATCDSKLAFGNVEYGSSVHVVEKAREDVDQTTSGQVDYVNLAVGTKDSAQDNIGIIPNSKIFLDSVQKRYFINESLLTVIDVFQFLFCARMHLMEVITGRIEVVAKVMFLHVSVILSTGGGLQAGRTPPGPGRPPPRPGRTPLGPGRPPRTRENPPPDQADPQQPPREADSRIRSTSGRYASYWNAFLFM